METKNLNRWDDFHGEIERLRETYGTCDFAGQTFSNEILFRGQSNADWELKTTLEQFSSRTWDLRSYLHVAHTCLPQIESYTDHRWGMLDWSEVESRIQKGRSWRLEDIPYYDYLIYLRHHGFPSPLLDWTGSPYIAAFFAFENKTDCERTAVFAFIERPTGFKGSGKDDPAISVLGPKIRTHRRHFLQQAWYTVATQLKDKTRCFVPHQSILAIGREDQDVLVKITFPMSERWRALNYLHDHNISRFSLFQTEEALVRTLAWLELESHDL